MTSGLACLVLISAFGSVLLVAARAGAQDAGAAEVCQRWTCDRSNLAEGTSTADTTTCSAGSWLAPGPANSLRLVTIDAGACTPEDAGAAPRH